MAFKSPWRMVQANRRRMDATIGANLGQAYTATVLGLGPIAYWPLYETAGLVAACLVNAAQNGTYSAGVTLANDATGPFGTAAPYFDGVGDNVNIFSAAFDAAFSGPVGSMAIWCRVVNAGAWTDGSERYALQIRDDANNYYRAGKSINNNRVTASSRAGAGLALMNYDPFSETGWYHAAVTWSDGNNDDETSFYINGARVAGPSAALNAWYGGGLDAARTRIGAQDGVGNFEWAGWLAHVVVADRVWSQSEITVLANP